MLIIFNDDKGVNKSAGVSIAADDERTGQEVFDDMVADGQLPEGSVFISTDPNDYLDSIEDVLTNRLGDVSILFYQKIGVGFTFTDPQQNQQVFAYSDSGLKWLDRAALRARKSKDNTENKTFKMRVVDEKIILTDNELIDIASDFYDWGADLDDIYQDHKDSLRDIADGAGTDAQKRIAIAAYIITTGW